MMKRLVTLAALLALLAPAAVAQSDDYHKFEFFGGYSYLNFDNLGGSTGNAAFDDVLGKKNDLHGFNLAANYNFHRYFGAKFDYSLHFHNNSFSRPQGSGSVHNSLQNYLFGLELKDNAKSGSRFRPFAHGLIGVAKQKTDVDSPQVPAIFGISDIKASKTSFAMAFGGGLDIRLDKHFEVRVVQADWNIIHRGDETLGIVLVPTPPSTVGQPFVLPGAQQDNLRLSFGIVIH